MMDDLEDGQYLLRGKRAWDIVDVACDWSKATSNDRTLVEAEWIVDPALTVIEASMDGPNAYIRVGGGVPGVDHHILCRAEFSDGTRDEVLAVLPVFGDA